MSEVDRIESEYWVMFRVDMRRVAQECSQNVGEQFGGDARPGNRIHG